MKYNMGKKVFFPFIHDVAHFIDLLSGKKNHVTNLFPNSPKKAYSLTCLIKVYKK